MDRNEILARLKKITGIEVPTEEQEKDIDDFLDNIGTSDHTDDEYESQTRTIADLQSKVSSLEKERDEIKERYRKRFWGEEENEKPKPKEKKKEIIYSLDDII